MEKSMENEMDTGLYGFSVLGLGLKFSSRIRQGKGNLCVFGVCWAPNLGGLGILR